MVVSLGGVVDEESQNGSKPQKPDEHQKRLQKVALMKRQDSWSGLKDRAFRVASTVVLPRPMRKDYCCDSQQLRSKSFSTSVKSLPQMKSYDDAKTRRERYVRSKSAQDRIQPAPTPTDEFYVALAIKRSMMLEVKSASIDEDNPQPLPAPSPPQSIGFSLASTKIIKPPRHSTIEEDADEDLPTSPCNTKDSTANCGLFIIPGESNNRLRTRTAPVPKFLALSFNNNEAQQSLLSLSSPSRRPSFASEALLGASSKSVYSTKSVAAEDSQEPSKTLDEKIDYDDSESEYLSEEEDKDSLSYENYYNCVPPPIFMFIITLVEVGFFIYHSKKLINNPNYGYIGKYSPAPLDSSLIYNPTRRYEVWRYITYAFVHSGYLHIINNIIVQLVLGVLLEIVHKWWRVLCIYFAGILAGSLATSITEPFNYLAGASGGVYALIAAHLSTVILNWRHMEYPWTRVLIFVAFLLHDGGTAVYFAYFVGEKTNVGYSAHIGGMVAGLLVGIHVLKNLQWSEWEIILWYTSIVICFCLLTFAIVWNIVRSDLFP